MAKTRLNSVIEMLFLSEALFLCQIKTHDGILFVQAATLRQVEIL